MAVRREEITFDFLGTGSGKQNNRQTNFSKTEAEDYNDRKPELTSEEKMGMPLSEVRPWIITKPDPDQVPAEKPEPKKKHVPYINRALRSKSQLAKSYLSKLIDDDRL